ncbi:HNH endonuclease [Eilatimonas milleporae]|uniref:HNH endonuclease n=1 Tax=Eilatimonas milleporae TaxID=911205 RepID=UPI001475B018
MRRAIRLLILQDGKCILCGKPVAVRDLSIHHFIPRDSGGHGSNLYNQTAAHVRCNHVQSAKAPKLMHWWRYRRLVKRILEGDYQRADWTIYRRELDGL